MGERSLSMKSMKLLLQTLVCMLLVAVCATASASEAVNCYWQLDEVRVETFSTQSDGCDAQVSVSAEPLSVSPSQTLPKDTAERMADTCRILAAFSDRYRSKVKPSCSSCCNPTIH